MYWVVSKYMSLRLQYSVSREHWDRTSRIPLCIQYPFDRLGNSERSMSVSQLTGRKNSPSGFEELMAALKKLNIIHCNFNKNV